MTAFVFTGADNTSLKLTRVQLVERCDHMGIVVHNKVTRNADFLVASRTDTSKAGDARALGVTVITYETFLTMWHVANGGTERLNRDDLYRIARTCGDASPRPSASEIRARVGAAQPAFQQGSDLNAIVYDPSTCRYMWQGVSYPSRADAQIAKNRYDFRQATDRRDQQEPGDYSSAARASAEAVRVAQARLDAIVQPGALRGRRAVNLDDD